MKRFKQNRYGFTLVELLTVIAIIALLAAILFPVFARVRAQARETSCISQQHEIYVALRLYREDFGKFPPVLLGYVQSDILGGDGKPTFYTGTGNPLAIDKLVYRPLTTGQRYLKDKDAFICPDNPSNITILNDPANQIVGGDTHPVFYPPTVPLGSPFRSAANRRVKYTNLIKETCCEQGIPIGQPAWFYRYDSYDTGPQIDANGLVPDNTISEAHYALDWTGTQGTDDPPNQLKYGDPPPDNTVITWCTHHAALAKSNKVMVLLLNGKSSPVAVNRFVQQGPLNYNPAN